MDSKAGIDLPLLSGPALQAQVDLLGVTAFAGALGTVDPTLKLLDAALGGHLLDAARAESFDGKVGQTVVLHTHGRIPAKRVILVGAGPRAEFQPAQLRDVVATVAAAANKAGGASVGFVLPALGAAKEAALLQHAAEGVIEGTYRFSRYLTGDDHKRPLALKSFGLILDAKGGKKLLVGQQRAADAALARGAAIAAAVNHARDLINEPAAAVTPTALANDAKAVAAKHKDRVTAQILGQKECAALGMGMFLAVGQGSAQEPKFIHLTYKPAKKAKKKIAFIGKGITFDSGGYSLKPSASMEDMKVDMSGAAAVISAIDAIATLGSEFEVHAVAACCENLVSGNAYKLGDVLVSMDGTTVEINNTDAEGRLTLGDAITYTRQKIQPDEIFDFATLTGACMVALGPYTAGVMSDNEALLKGWMAAAQAAGEDMWRLPLNPRLREQLKSSVADMRNTGDRWGGAITAGLFLKTFAKDTPWVHVDIAGPASVSTARPSQPKGGTGFAVASMVEYAARK